MHLMAHLMAHLIAYLRFSPRVRSWVWDVPFLWSLLVSFGHRSAFLAHTFAGHSFFVFPCQIPVSQQVSEIPSFQTSIGFLCAFFFPPAKSSVFESQSRAPLYNHVSVKNISTYFSEKELLFFRAAFCCVCLFAHTFFQHLHCFPNMFYLCE